MSITEENKRFFRCSKLLIDYGGEVIQKYINKYCEDQSIDFETFLNNNRHDLLHIKRRQDKKCCIQTCKLKHNGILTKPQWETLFTPAAAITDAAHQDIRGKKHSKNGDVCFMWSEAKSGIAPVVCDISLSSALVVNVSNFAKNLILSTGTFEDFLNQNKELLFHCLKERKCCNKCSYCTRVPVEPVLCALFEKEFLELFDDQATPQCAIGVSCICCYTAKPAVILNSCSVIVKKKLAQIVIFPEVVVIRELRNDIHAHAKECSVDSSTFESIWRKTSCRIQNLAIKIDKDYGDSITDKIQNLKTCPYEQQWETDVKEFLKRDALCLEIFQKAVQLQEETLVCTENIQNILLYAEVKTKQTLEDHLSDSLYISPKAAETKILELLNEKGIAIISGYKGSGKSTLAHQCMIRICKDLLPQIYVPLIIRSPYDWKTQCSRDKRYVFYFEDIIGKSNIDTRYIEEWENEFQDIWRIVRPGSPNRSFAIMSIRENLLVTQKTRLQRYDLFGGFDGKIVNLSILAYMHSMEERISLLRRYCEKSCIATNVAKEEEESFFNKMKDKEVGEITSSCYLDCKISDGSIHAIAEKNPPGFPLLCSLFFSKQPGLLKKGISFFERSDDDMKELMVNLRETQPNQFCALLALSIFEEVKFSATDKFTKDFNLKLANINITIKNTGICCSIWNCENLRETLSLMLDVYVRRFKNNVESIFQFKHPYFREAVLFSFGEFSPKSLIDIGSTSILQRFIRPSFCDESLPSWESCMLLPMNLDEYYIEQLYKRLDDVLILVEHPLCKSNSFVENVIDRIMKDKKTCQTFLRKIFLTAMNANHAEELLVKNVIQNMKKLDMLTENIIGEIIRRDWLEVFKCISKQHYRGDISKIPKIMEQTCLFFAGRCGSVKIARYLIIQCKENYYQQGNCTRDTTFLQHCIDNDWLNMLTDILMLNTLDFQLGSNKSKWLLTYAATSGSECVFMGLYAIARTLNVERKFINDAFYKCIQTHKVDSVNKIIQDYPDILHRTFNDGATPLVIAALSRDKDLAIRCIEANVVLHTAIFEEDKNIIQICIENDDSENGDESWLEVLKLLLETRSDDVVQFLKIASKSEFNALVFAIKNDKYSCAKCLLEWNRDACVQKLQEEIMRHLRNQQDSNPIWNDLKF